MMVCIENSKVPTISDKDHVLACECLETTDEDGKREILCLFFPLGMDLGA